MLDINNSDINIGIIGLGYVGLPLAIAFSKHFNTIGYDINAERVEALQQGIDINREANAEQLSTSNKLQLSANEKDLAGCNVYIVTVPTPIDGKKEPNLSPIINATELIANFLSKDNIVIYESTVYPGVTEEICTPLLSINSGLNYNQDFFTGYSPERINPGDTKRSLTDILKITSGSTPEAAAFIDALYQKIITAGTYKAESIKVAEAAKVIENTQRDLNIALANELSIIFHQLGIDTNQVLDAAATKWNFHRYTPGLVGGHCIGVDPYYLAHKAKALGYKPDVILAGRAINDSMGEHVAVELIKTMIKKGIDVSQSRILILGMAFKENCPDVRNSKVIDIYQHLDTLDIAVDIHDPVADSEACLGSYGISLTAAPQAQHYDAVVLAVPHTSFTEMGADKIKQWGKENAVFFDLKAAFNIDDSDFRL